MQRLILGNKDISTSLKFDNEFSVVAFPIYEDSIEVEYLVVGGGGSGGTSANESLGVPDTAGGGGGAGSVATGSFTLTTGSADLKVGVGLKGLKRVYNPNGSTQNGRGNIGYPSYVTEVDFFNGQLAVAGGGGRGLNTEVTVNATGGPSGLNQVGQELTGSFANFIEGGFNDFFDDAAGGGAGSSQVGQDGTNDGGTPRTNTGGNGGQGVTVSDWYWNSSLDVVGAIAGGGGASAHDGGTNIAGVGSFGGGDGAINSDDASDATTFGSGGGGSYEANSGAGKDGLVVLRYKNRFKINDSGDEVFQSGDYWYHTYTTGSLTTFTFERPEKILVSI